MTMKKTLTTTTTSSSIQQKQPSSSSTSSASQTATQIKSLLKKNSQKKNEPIALNEQADANRLDELRRIFSKLQSTNELSLSHSSSSTTLSSSSSSTSSAAAAVKEKWNTWLKKQHSVYITQLSNVIQTGRKSSLRTFMGVIASSPIKEISTSSTSTSSSSKHICERMNPNLLQQLIQALIQPLNTSTNNNNNEDGIISDYMMDLLEQDFISKYRDVQYYMLTCIKVIAGKLYRQIEMDEKNQKKKKKKMEDREEDEDEEAVDHDIIGIYAENLLRILLKIQIADDQQELNPVDVKVEDGTCSNYLFLPPNYQIVDTEEEEEDDNEDDNDDDNDDEEEDDDVEDDHKGRNHDDDEDNENNNKKEKQKKNKPKLSPMQSIRKHRHALQEATLAILKIPSLPPRALKLALQHFPSNILPNATNPLRYADFCTRAYDMGGITSLLALNSLFILMLQCGLEYKDFYPSLYNLIEPKVFYAKYRTRFFKLLVKCLTGNQMLPAYLVAAFCKKLCRCALNAPPSGCLFVLALVSNLLRKHEECACLIHRSGASTSSSTSKEGKIQDVYNIDEKDPIKSKAIESSLWELNALEQHYHPAVSSMAKGCGMEDNQMLMHNLDEFLLHTYKSLFDQERKRAGNKRGKKLPLTFQKPIGLFVEDDVFDGVFGFPNAKKQKTNLN